MTVDAGEKTLITVRARRHKLVQSPLRVAILTDSSAFYAAPLLLGIFASPEISIEKIYLAAPLRPFSEKFKVIKKSGWSYFIARSWSLFRTKATRALQRRRYLMRGGQDTHTIKGLANKHSIPISPLSNINKIETARSIAAERYDVILSVFFSQIISKEALKELREILLINLHPSLLPRYAGTNPIFWALANGDKITGMTAHVLIDRFDAGPILRQHEEPILSDDTFHTIYQKVAENASPMIRAMLVEIATSGAHDAEVQDLRKQVKVSAPTPNAYRQFKKLGRKFF